MKDSLQLGGLHRRICADGVVSVPSSASDFFRQPEGPRWERLPRGGRRSGHKPCRKDLESTLAHTLTTCLWCRKMQGRPQANNRHFSYTTCVTALDVSMYQGVQTSKSAQRYCNDNVHVYPTIIPTETCIHVRARNH